LIDELKESLKMATNYIHKRQTQDGGYFFARIPPGNLQDTFFAVKSLQVLGQQPRKLAFLKKFVSSFQSEYASGNIHALYLASGILLALDETLNKYRANGITALSQFNWEELFRFESLDVEVVSELKHIFEAVNVFITLDIHFDKELVASIILSLLNKDGGFGRNQHSTLATTYFGVATLLCINFPLRIPELTLKYLRRREKETYFIEDLYYLKMASALLGERPSSPTREDSISYLLGYQNVTGGFARSRIMGISTLEYTYYAISLLKQYGAIPLG